MGEGVDRRGGAEPQRPGAAGGAPAGQSFNEDLRRGLVAALPCLLTLALAGAFTRVRMPIRAGDLPLGLLAIVLVQAAGYAVARGGGQLDRARHWLMALVATAIVLPVIALQAAFAREPFVSFGRGSAAGLLWMTLAAALVLVVAFAVACGLAAAAPADGSLLFVPVAAVVPAVAAAPLGLNDQDALGALAVAMLVAGVAIGFGTILPDGWRPPVGPIALGGEFVLLWALRRSPHFAPEHGRIVPALSALLLALTVVAIVLAPLGALAARRFAATVAGAGEDGDGGSRLPPSRRGSGRPRFTPPRNRRR